MEMESICVFCGSRVGEKAGYLAGAIALGKILAETGIRLVYGGSSTGLMGAVADSCLQNGGSVTGVIPRKLVELEVAHPGLSALKIVDTMHQRKAMMAELSDGFIALPGGIGTLEETLEMFTWTQLGIHAKPIGLLNSEGYYDTLALFLRHVVQEGFMRQGHLEMLLIEADERQIINRLKSYQPRHLPKLAGIKTINRTL